MAIFDAETVMKKAKEKKTNNAEVISEKQSLPAAELYSGNSSVSKENIRRLPAVEVDPKLCRPWKFHNRDKDWLTKENCSDLIKSIEANGQIEPGLVRRLEDDPDYEYEIIYGVRRWYSVSQIKGKKFLARLSNASDRDCMVLMHIENADSQDISDFERAYSFLQHIRSNEFKSQKDLAEAMNVSTGLVSRMIQAAEIFDYDFISEVILTKKDLPIKSCQLLASFLRDAGMRAKVKAKCHEIRKDVSSVKLKPKEILKTLIATANGEGEIEKELDENALRGLKAAVDSKGALTIKIAPSVRKQSSDVLRQRIMKIIDEYVME